MSLREYLPSKRIGYVIIILVIIIIVFFALQYIPNIKKTTIFSKNTTAENQQASSKIGDIVNKDIDGDGVFDWEESIRGTDPSKTDTDGDGVSDFTEIEQLRAQESGTEQNTPETETSIFAKQLFTTVASLQESGNLNEESASKIINQASLSAQKNVQKTFYTKDQLVVSSKITSATFEKTTDAILAKYDVTYESLQNIFLILTTIPETGEVEGTTIVQDLTATDSLFKKALPELLKNPVPTKSADVYLSFLNTLQYVSENISDIALIETNPIVSFSAITVYPENVSSLIEVSYKMLEEYKK